MATIIGGIGASHSPTIGYAADTNKSGDPAWAPIFEGFREVQQWVEKREIDVLFMIFNDHITSFFFDHYPAFALGVDDSYQTADEGGGARNFPAVKGQAALARHIAESLMMDEFDLSVFQKKPLDHGCFSPLSMICPDAGAWPGSIIPFQVGVLQWPVPTANRCYKLGKALRRAIHSYPEDLRVAIVATGGLSHQVHGERCGFNNEEWDQRFLDLLENKPEQLAAMRIAEYAELGGYEGAEVIMWLIMRGALSDQVRKVHSVTYLPSMTNIATVIYEDIGPTPSTDAAEKHRRLMGHQLSGVEKLEGTYPFDLETSHRAYRINDFLHRLIEPGHRRRFLEEPQTLFEEFRLTEEEQTMIRERRWIDMIRYGVIFFSLEKMGAVVGVSNPEIYASMRGEDLETFQKTRNVSMKYSVGQS
ncbi:gallate dioxygenase [Marinobacter oulmenensis]|uniref:Gallate dioxygenase n=1 Tax=Marinobacter oulmenensis TaxID=643747 RepID=A0A840U9T6_9GAMM|nr:gallate dioxygenase [Marinobacter oulmenensis]MBB5321752.1 gallate dioxygenase [Marinobacter oulmenensis]